MKCEVCECVEQRRKFMEDKAGLSFLKTLPATILALVILGYFGGTPLITIGSLSLGWFIFKLFQIGQEEKFTYKKEE